MTDDSNGPKGYFHTTEHQAQDINWGDLPRRVSDLGSGRGIWQVSVVVEKLHCVVLLGFFWVCLFVFLFFITIIIFIYYYFGISLYFQLLSHSYVNIETLLQFSSSFHRMWGKRGGVSAGGCVVFHLQLGLKLH